MAKDNCRETPNGCPICGTATAATLEFDRPTILLCMCDGCGKFVVRKETLLQLKLRGDFGPSRWAISGYNRNHFQKLGSPLQIILFNERPLARHSITIGELMSVCQEGMHTRTAKAMR